VLQHRPHAHLLCEQNLLIVKVRAMEAVYLLLEVVPFAVLFLLVLFLHRLVLRYDISFPLPLAVVAVPHVVSPEPLPVPHVVFPGPVPMPHVVLPEPVPVPHVLFSEPLP
jgi:hypothetical protein